MQILGGILLLCLSLLAATAASPDYTSEIRPILERSCYGCHGPEKQKNAYRLDRRDSALKGGDSGKAAILPHNAKGSPLIRYVSGEDDEIFMPPKTSKATPLSPAEIQLLRAWIDAGPAWPEGSDGTTEKPHWSLQPLVRPAVPAVPAGAASNPIDAFIRVRLATMAPPMAPSSEADRRTLIRRLTCDLTGLPPTPEETEAFLADPDVKAYEKLVDRLLASPRLGERWARHWFDTIHFADSHGYEHDLARDNAWRFRDYVIAAFNRDTPWPRFIREQLAADVFFPEQTELTAALGYLGAGTFDMSTYATAPVTFDYLDRDDMVTQTMSAFVSTTANCARCHAHKFDPISQEDYYALQAVFAGITKGEISYDEDRAVARQRRECNALVAAAEKRDATVLLSSTNTARVNQWESQQGPGVSWERLDLETFLALDGTTLTLGPDDQVLAGGSRPEKDTYTVTATTQLTNVTAIRLEVLAREGLPAGGPGRADNGNLHLSEIELRVFRAGESNARPAKIRRATADFNQDGWGIERAFDGNLTTAWGIHPAEGRSHQAVFELAEPIELPAGSASRLAIILKQVHGGGHLIGGFRLAATGADPARAVARPSDVEAALALDPSHRSETQRVAIAAYALQQFAAASLSRLPPPSIVFAAGASVNLLSGDPPRQAKSLSEPKVVHVLKRGDFTKPGATAEPGALSALTHLPARFALKNPRNEGERRAALADWLAHRDNVLTWRSVVNRVWQYHFGRGLCDTPSDFGKMGGVPSHPELIDWLAVWFRDDAGGSLKSLHRLIVTSATYRQASVFREGCARLDSENRLLWRQNRQRLDADCFRDYTLAASGALDLKMGGPAVQHFKQSKGPQATPALDYQTYDWSRPEAGRRSIYRYVWRGIADPFMEALDFPDLGLLSPTRGFSASSLQALTLYNNDYVLHQCEVMARRVAAEAKTVGDQVTRAVQLTWSRRPTGEEQKQFTKFVESQSLPAFCRLLFNSDEFLFVD